MWGGDLGKDLCCDLHSFLCCVTCEEGLLALLRETITPRAGGQRGPGAYSCLGHQRMREADELLWWTSRGCYQAEMGVHSQIS